MSELDADLISGILAVAALLLVAIAAIVAGRHSPAETLEDTLTDPRRWG